MTGKRIRSVRRLSGFLLMSCLGLWILSSCASSEAPRHYEITRTDGYVQVDSLIRLHYRVVGQGPDTVVVLHGGPGLHMNYLEPDLRPLALSHTLIFYDQRSAGQSKPLITDTTKLHWQKYVSDLEEIRKHFGLGKLNLLGHSWGGLYAALYAMEHPSRVDRLLLLDAGPAYHAHFQRIDEEERMDERSIKKETKAEEQWGNTPDSTNKCWAFYRQDIKGYLDNPAYGGQTWGDVCNAPQEAMLKSSPVDNSLGNYDLRGRFEGLEAPVYIVHGENDKIPVDIAREWDEAFPNAQLTVIEKAGHFPYFENPETFFPAAKAFFQGEWPVDVSQAKSDWPPAPEKASSDYERRWWEITAAHDRLEQAFRRQKPAMGASVYTDDAILFPPTVPPIRGHRQIRAFLRGTFKKGARSAEFQTLDLEGTAERLTEGGRYTLRDGSGEILDMGKYLVVWKKVGGTWKAHRDMFNTTMEVPSELYEYDMERWQAGQPD